MKLFGNSGNCWTVSALMFYPLFEYCKMIGINILDGISIPLCLEGWGLNADVSKQLENALQSSINRGNCKVYVEFFQEQHARLITTCLTCDGSGFSKIVRSGTTKMCQNCKGTGKALPLQFNLTVDVVQEFTSFLREAGGFVIRGASIAPSLATMHEVV